MNSRFRSQHRRPAVADEHNTVRRFQIRRHPNPANRRATSFVDFGITTSPRKITRAKAWRINSLRAQQHVPAMGLVEE
jgi:hypothetical protein